MNIDFKKLTVKQTKNTFYHFNNDNKNLTGGYYRLRIYIPS